jgi:hypothetical protein
MTPMQTMFVTGTVSALGGTVMLVSGGLFKRALDAYSHVPTPTASATATATATAPGPPLTAPGSISVPARVEVGLVKSVDQKGGVTAGYVGSVNQAPSEK